MGRSLSSDRSPYRRPFSFLILLRWVIKLRLLWLILVAFLFLSGCVRYEVGIHFADANHGEIVQQVELSQQLTGVSRATANLWLEQLATEAKKLGGQVTHPSDRSIGLKIPFYNAKDLVAKFDRFFQAFINTGLVSPPAPLSHLQIKTHNFVLWQRNHLIYDLDLRSLSLVPNADDTAVLLINPKDLLKLELTLKAHDVRRLENAGLTEEKQQNQQVWQLQPGKINHIEAIFWVPSPIGIGFAVIVLLVGGGMFFQAWQHPSTLIDLPPDRP